MQVEYLVTAEEMKKYDKNTITQLGLPGMVLMERAALAAFSAIEDYFGKHAEQAKTVLIMAGIGNNGGDGLALARLLAESDYDVTLHYVGDADKASSDWKVQRQILDNFPVRTTHKICDLEYTVMVDALFGVGLSRTIEGVYAKAVEMFNKVQAFKIALDVPSGICSDSGEILGCAVKVNQTITFGFCKRGLVLYPGAEYAGKVSVAPIGITKMGFMGQEPSLFCYTGEKMSAMPDRECNGNKGSFGKVLLVAGSYKMAGAAILSAKAAYRIGAGMVKIISCEENRIIIQQAVPEALFGTEEDLQNSLSWADVVAIGPGIGMEQKAKECLEQVIQKSGLPLIMDADALNLLAKHKELYRELINQGKNGRKVILTPHVGELSRLMNVPVTDLKVNLWKYGKMLARELHAVIVAKDARTVICREEGSDCLNTCGNSGMATAGSGDVLTGVIAGLTAQGMEAFQAAGIGVYLHGKAGDSVAEKIGEHACMAGDLLSALGK